MKLTVTQWTIVQSVLDKELKDRPGSRFLDLGIENKTFGKQWSASVSIGMDQSNQSLVYDALEIIAKGDEKGEIDWPKPILEAAPRWRLREKAKYEAVGSSESV